MPALTETEARARAALIEVVSYDLFADLTAEPVRSRTEIRFTCAEPGADTFADLAATAASAVLNGREVGAPGWRPRTSWWSRPKWPMTTCSPGSQTRPAMTAT